MDHPQEVPDVTPNDISVREGPKLPVQPRMPGIDPARATLVAGPYTGGFLEYWRMVRRHRGTVIILTCLGGLTGFLIGLPQTPVYRSRATVEVQTLNENLLNTRQVDPTPGPSEYSQGDIDIQTQIKLLQSESLIERTVAKLKLDRRPESLEQPGRLSVWLKALGVSDPSRRPSSHEEAVGMAAGNLKLKALPQTRVIEITCDSTDAGLAADFANTLIREYTDLSLESRWESAQHTGEWLNRQLEELRINLEKSEDRLQSYARATGLMFVSEKDSVAEQRLRQLQGELSTAQADRIAKQSKYEMAKSSSPGSLPEVLDDTSLRDYQEKLTELRRQLAELTTSLTPAHPKVERIQAQIAEVESALERERTNIVKRIQNEQDAAQRREQLLATEYATQARLVSEQAEKTVHYNILKREVDTNRQLYDAMLQKVKEYGIASAMRASNIRIVDRAKPARLPFKPDLFRYAEMGLFGGLVLAVVFVVLREGADRSIQAPGDASLYLRLPELGVVPSAKADPGLRAALKRSSLLQLNPMLEGNETGGTRRNGGKAVELVTWQRKRSLLAESFRATLESILFSAQNGDSPRVIVVTSTAPMDGKTTTVTNLGIALAEINRLVLLIDGDLRRPKLHQVFGLGNSKGLSDILHDRKGIEEYSSEDLAHKTDVPGLYVLPSRSGTLSIANLLHSPRMTEMLGRLRHDFDNIIIDSPPMPQISDARVLGRLADGVILVIRAGHTTRDTALAAAQRLAEDGTPLLGTILNDWNPKISTGYGYYDTSYYHYYHHGNGSDTESPNDPAN